MAGANAGRLAFGFVASVVIARSVGASDFGVYALLATLAAIAGVLGDPGLTPAGVKRVASAWPAMPDTARARGQVFFWLRIGAILPVVAIGVLLSGPLARFILGQPQMASLVALTFIGAGATGASGAASALLQGTVRFRRLALVMLANSALTAILALGFARSGHLTLVMAVVALGIGTSLVSLILAWALLPWPHGLALPRPAAIRREAEELLRFGRWLWVADILEVAGTRLDVLLVNAWSPLSAVGTYALALNLASKADIVHHSLYTVLLPTGSALRDRDAERAYVRRALWRSALIGVALLPLFPLAAPLITLFYGPAFHDAILLFRVLLVVVLFDLFATPLNLLALAFDHPGLMASAEVLRISVLIGAAAWLIPRYGPLGAVGARAASRVAGACLILTALWLARRVSRLSIPSS